MGAIYWAWDMPAEPGRYWFYGWPNRRYAHEHDPELYLVKVHKTAVPGEFARVTDNRFLYECEVWGVWQKAELPLTPAHLPLPPEKGE